MSNLLIQGLIAANSALCFGDCTDAVIVHFLDFAHFVNIDRYASLASHTLCDIIAQLPPWQSLQIIRV